MTEEFKPLDCPSTRMSAECAIVELLRSIGGQDLEGWEVVLDTTLRNTRASMQAESDDE
jgi:hypothetical protein